MTNLDDLKRNDKIMIVYGESADFFQGYLTEINGNNIILQEYVTDIYRTFSLDSVLEISKV